MPDALAPDLDLSQALRDAAHPKAATAVLQRAIDQAGERGGGKVVVPPGVWTVTTFFLRSGVTLHLSRGAVLQAHLDLADYPKMVKGHNKDRTGYHFLVAEDCREITIEGDGVLDGRGESFWERPLRDLKAEGVDISADVARAPGHWPINGPWWRGWKPRISPMIELKRCKNVVLRDVIIRNSPGWTVHPYCCDQVRIDGITIDNHIYGPNTDGIDVNGCRDVMIANCRIHGCDDNIILKATEDARCCERITVTNCTLRTMCAALGLGAETTKGLRDIAFSNCVVEQALRMVHFNMWEPGLIENVTVSNITGRTMTPADVPMEKVVYMDVQSHGRGPDCELGHIRNVVVQGITATTRGRCILTANDRARIEDVTLRDIQLTYPDGCDDNVALAPITKSSQNNNDNLLGKAANAVLVAENVHRLRVDNLSARLPAAGGAIPKMHGAWLRRCSDVILDCPWLAANAAGHPSLAQQECDRLTVRALG